jgi:hypothetical protein
LRTHERPKEARTGAYLLHLLERMVGPTNREALFELILGLQAEKKREVDELTDRPLRTAEKVLKMEAKLRQRGGTPRDGVNAAASKLLSSGFTMEEPFMQLQVAKLREDVLKQLKKGKLVLPGASGSDESKSCLLVGVADPTGSLAACQVAPFVNGACVPEPAGLGADEPYEALAYRDPGMSPGDLRKVEVKYTEQIKALMKAFGQHSEMSRVNVVFFSAKGDPRHNHRSLADMLAGGDYDGDEYQIILWQKLVKLAVNESPPYDKDAPLPPLTSPKASAAGGRKGRASAAAANAHAAIAQPQCKCGLCMATRQQAQQQEKSRMKEAEEQQKREVATAAEAEACAREATAQRASRGKAQQQQQTAERARAAVAEAEKAERARHMQERLLSNYLTARFLGSPMVGSSATRWMIFADRYAASGGAHHPACLHLAHEYLQALDAEGRDTLGLSAHRRLPKELQCSDFPAYMKDKFEQRAKRAVGRGGGGASSRRAKLVEPCGSLVGVLWQLDCTVSADKMIRVDKHLTPELWMPEHELHKIEHLKDEMRKIYRYYAQRVSECISSSVEEGWSEEDWGRYDALIMECEAKLVDGVTLTFEERYVETPKWLYGRVAALYVVCYEMAKDRSRHVPSPPLQQAQLLAQERQHTGGNDACASSSGRGSGEGGSNGACEQHTALSSVDAPIKFPWRLASYYLTQMKEKRVALDRARQLYGDD